MKKIIVFLSSTFFCYALNIGEIPQILYWIKLMVGVVKVRHGILVV